MFENTHTFNWDNPEHLDIYDDESIVFQYGMCRYVMLESEFDWLATELHILCFKKRLCGYIQFVKEWNEIEGYNDLNETPSKLLDKQASIEALECLLNHGESNEVYSPYKLKNEELISLIQFFKMAMERDAELYIGKSSRSIDGSAEKMNVG